MTRPQILHYDSVDAFSFRAAGGFIRTRRFQVIALAPGAKLVGWWRYDVQRRGTIIDSSYTWVTPGFRRSHVARDMWLAGIARWNPRKIYATAGSWRGCYFLAAMTVLLAELRPALRFDVDPGDFEDSFRIDVRDLALARLRAIGKDSTSVHIGIDPAGGMTYASGFADPMVPQDAAERPAVGRAKLEVVP